VAERYEAATAQLIRSRIGTSNYLEAAAYYKSCIAIPVGEKQKYLTEPFDKDKYSIDGLLSLSSLPFRAIVTTNYDRALHDAYSQIRRVAPQCVELNDGTLKRAAFWEHYIARIHGRAEVPESLILDNIDYNNLYTNAEYEDFLKVLLTQNRCVFVGFSFFDPAIARIFQFIKDKGTFPALHFALVPQGQTELDGSFSKFNIEVATYNNNDNKHETLWKAIDLAAKEILEATPSENKTFRSLDIAKRLLAVCYARVSMGIEGESLRDIVVEGIVLSELRNGNSSVQSLTELLRIYMALSESESRIFIESALNRLKDKQICLCDEDTDTVIIVDEIEPKTSPVEILVEGIVARLALREKYTVTPAMRDSLCGIVEEVIVLRGFDLGAEFSGANIYGEIDIYETMSTVIDKHLQNFWQDRKLQIAQVFRELIKHPDEKEEAVLGELGRISFGIEIVLQAGRSTMYALSLPEVVYLDASVLMPSIVVGHPNQVAYEAAILRLQEAAKRSGGSTSIQIADVFLDEIVNHRARAIEVVEREGLENLEVLKKRVLFHGADRLNVYIGAYSRWIDPKRKNNHFVSFLKDVAPYTTASELSTYLRKRGYSVATTRARDSATAARQYAIAQELEKAYGVVATSSEVTEVKPFVLIKHEALQIELMQQNQNSNKRQLFVTADMVLRKAVMTSTFHMLADELITPRNLVQFVDLLIGMNVPPKDLSRLLWSVKAADQRSEIKDYLLKRALVGYNSARLLRMNELIDGFVERIEHNAGLEGVNITATDTEGRMKTSRYMDRVETEIFARLAKEVSELEQRIKHLETGKR
jgi:hypothetical protein